MESTAQPAGAIRKIAVIGNGGGGKTTLSKKLGTALNIPVYHVDSIQYKAGWQYVPVQECDQILTEIISLPTWLVDGFGSHSAIERRLCAADTIIFIDFPIWRHYCWALKRQWKSKKFPRTELPDGCSEYSVSYTLKLVEVMWNVHKNYTPWFRKIIKTLPGTISVFHLRHPRDIEQFLNQLGLNT